MNDDDDVFLSSFLTPSRCWYSFKCVQKITAKLTQLIRFDHRITTREIIHTHTHTLLCSSSGNKTSYSTFCFVHTFSLLFLFTIFFLLFEFELNFF